MPRSLISLLVLLALAGTAGGATAAGSSSITVVHRNQTVRIAARPGGTQACLAAVTYSNGMTQNIGVKSAELGKVSFTIRIPAHAPLGPAHWSIRCGPTWSVAGTWRIAPAPAPLPVVRLTNNGFSQRPDANTLASHVSFGLFLKNTSTVRDARNVFLLINFVGRNGALVGSTSRTVALVPAGQTLAYGGGAELASRTAVSRLEVTVRAGSGAAAARPSQPAIANVTIVPDPADPAWVAEVDGELANDKAGKTFASAQVWVVVLDKGGRIVGGGSTAVTTPLPPGSRTLFATRTGVTSIPSSRAATALVSALPRF